MTLFERRSLWVTSILTGLTGIGLFWTKYLTQSADPWSIVNNPLQPWMLKLHILVAPLLVFALGLVAVRHVWHHYRERIRRGRRSGITAALMVVPMIGTGYLIQVLTRPGWVRVVALSHIAFGALYLAGVALHQVVLHRRLRTGARAPGGANRYPEGEESSRLRRIESPTAAGYSGGRVPPVAGDIQ